MKNRQSIWWVVLAVFISISGGQISGRAEDASPAPADAAPKPANINSDLATATDHLKSKINQGQTNATDLAENQTEIEGLIQKYAHSSSREQVARLYLLDAHISELSSTNDAKAQAIWNQIIRDFPTTAAAKGASISLAKSLAKTDDPSIPEGLEVGQRFPGFSATDTAGNPLSPANYRGKILMIDFWATWCGPCKGEMPNVIATYQQYHLQGFDIIGISLDEDLNELANFTAAQKMPWRQYCDGLGWKNQIAGKYGVESIPMDYLLDRHGVILGKELRGRELPEAVAKALAANQ